jgi:hypothetical protein
MYNSKTSKSRYGFKTFTNNFCMQLYLNKTIPLDIPKIKNFSSKRIDFLTLQHPDSTLFSKKCYTMFHGNQKWS